MSAQSTLAYFGALEARFGAALGRSVRLFMVPGMDHCRGGPGADQFGGAGGDAPLLDPEHDMLSALEAWVIDGRAPERLVASKIDGSTIVRTHLLCAWRQYAAYAGSGDSDSATHYICRKG